MSFFTKQLTDLTFNDVVELVYIDKQKESVFLDYKSGINPQKIREDISKDVSSFANHYGGFLIYGVDYDETTAEPRQISGVSDAVSLKKQIVQICASPQNLQPPIFLHDPVILSGADRNGGNVDVLIVRIDRSSFPPHFYLGGTRFYVRVADNSLPQEGTLDTLMLLLNGRERNELIRTDKLNELHNLSLDFMMQTYYGRHARQQIPAPYLQLSLQPTLYDPLAIPSSTIKANFAAAHDSQKGFVNNDFQHECSFDWLARREETFAGTVLYKVGRPVDYISGTPNVIWTSGSVNGLLYHFQDLPLRVDGNAKASVSGNFSLELEFVLRRIVSFLILGGEYFQNAKKHFALDFIARFSSVKNVEMLYNGGFARRQILDNDFVLNLHLTTYDLMPNKIWQIVRDRVTPELVMATNYPHAFDKTQFDKVEKAFIINK